MPYIENPEQFKQAIHNFTEDRNHVAHSKVLSWSSYQIILGDFNKMDGFIRQADAEFESKVTSDEVLETWDAIQEEERNEREYYRERIANEAGVDILDADEIKVGSMKLFMVYIVRRINGIIWMYAMKYLITRL